MLVGRVCSAASDIQEQITMEFRPFERRFIESNSIGLSGEPAQRDQGAKPKFKVGDRVVCARRFEGEPGWVSDMDRCLGKIGTVIDTTYHIDVEIPGHTNWVWPPESLDLVTQEANKMTEITLKSVGSNKIGAIKAIRDITDPALGLREAKNLVDLVGGGKPQKIPNVRISADVALKQLAEVGCFATGARTSVRSLLTQIQEAYDTEARITQADIDREVREAVDELRVEFAREHKELTAQLTAKDAEIARLKQELAKYQFEPKSGENRFGLLELE